MNWDLAVTLVILGAALGWAGWRLRRFVRRGRGAPAAGCGEGCAGASCRLSTPDPRPCPPDLGRRPPGRS